MGGRTGSVVTCLAGSGVGRSGSGVACLAGSGVAWRSGVWAMGTGIGFGAASSKSEALRGVGTCRMLTELVSRRGGWSTKSSAGSMV